MSLTPPKSIADIVHEVGRYPESAFDFVREGLSQAVERVHGAPTPSHAAINDFLTGQHLEIGDLYELHAAGRLPPNILAAIRDAGGLEKLNRHVGGQDLCWALRDLALARWGRLAAPVLKSWRITQTIDFGHLVFAMIKHRIMHKQPHDRLADFADVYDFREAFDLSFNLGDERRSGS
ncbi:MAG TPA: Minf_1886 family protein [Phycisphaerae bacterium]|jgi:uncharacterized repeat protein (TIGR04138 family)